MKQDNKLSFEGKYGDHTYPIQIVGRHIEITDAMRSYAIEKLDRIAHFGLKIKDVIIAMDIQKITHTVSYIVDIAGLKLKVHGSTDTMYSAIDEAANHLETKLERYHKKITEHHAKKIEEIEAQIDVIAHPTLTDEVNDAIEEENLRHSEVEFEHHEVVKKQTYRLKTLTQDEAVMKMDLSHDAFLLYRSEEDQKMKVIYRLEDGNYGIIQTEK